MIDEVVKAIAEQIRRFPPENRALIAIAGPPGAGKSRIARALVDQMNAESPDSAVLVPMDGYHYDNQILRNRGLMARKGAPHTFNCAGLMADLQRIKAGEAVAVPEFDREADLARANAIMVSKDHRLIVIEGNYLLLDQPGWTALSALFDLTIMLMVSEAELERRLVKRWKDHGLAQADAHSRAHGNDIPNARLVRENSHPADIDIQNE